MKIRDFTCTYENSSGMNAEITRDLGLHFPEAHFHKESMVKLAIAIKEHDQAPFCELPFCHTIEGENLGAIINLGDHKTGPRAGDYICHSIEELKDLPPFDFSKGRMKEMLDTARYLTSTGQAVMYEVCGPITILGLLIDPRHIFKAMRKEPELMGEIFRKLGDQILGLIQEIKNCGVTMVSYADVVAGVNILGPRMLAQMMELFVYDFVKKLEKLTDDHFTVYLCPKMTYALIDTGHAAYRKVKLAGSTKELTHFPMTYQEACVAVAGKVKFGGQMCIKNHNYLLKDGIFKELVLLE